MTAAVAMRRREFHAAQATATDSLTGARQMFMPFRHAGVIAPGFEFKPGFIYTQVRAISARINQNFDGWPSAELKKSYRSFLGKPVFVNHQNFDPTKARGKVVAARYVEAGDDKYVDVVQEIDAARFPKLAREIISGGLDSVSMGVEAGFTICSYCNNKAVDTPDFCDHVRYHKGQTLRTASGENVLVYEKCFKLGFFELSYVFDPADETAVVSRVIAAGNKQANPLPPLPDDLQERALFHEWLDEHPQYAEWLGEHQNVGEGRVTEVGEHEGRRVISASARALTAPETVRHYESKIDRLAYYDRNTTLPDGRPRYGPNYHRREPNPYTPEQVDRNFGAGGNPTPEQLMRKRMEGRIDRLAYGEEGSNTPSSVFAKHYTFEPTSDGIRVMHHDSGSYLSHPDDFDGHVAHFPTVDHAVGAAMDSARRWGYLASRHHAYGEVEAPEDVDTLRNEGQDDNDDFKHYVESPKELQGPDLDQTKRLDRVQEQEGLDSNRNVEDVEDIGGHLMPQRTSRRRQAGDPPIDPLGGLGGGMTLPQKAKGWVDHTKMNLQDRAHDVADQFRGYDTPYHHKAERHHGAPFGDPRDAIDEERPFSPEEYGAMKHQYREPAPMLVDPRTGRRYYAADEDAPPDAPPGGDPSGDPSGGGGQSDEELIQEAEQDLEAAEDQESGGDDVDSDEGGTDDDYSDQDDDGEPDGDEDDGGGPDDGGGGGDLPPWLADGDTEDSGPPPPSDRESRRVNRRSSTQKKRRTRKGAPMGLAERQRVASGQWPRRHYADDSGHTDGGPYHVDDNDQGEQEDVYISQTPGSEAVAAPVPGDGTISNTENNLVARIQRRNAELRRDIIAYEQITGRRVTSGGHDLGDNFADIGGQVNPYTGGEINSLTQGGAGGPMNVTKPTASRKGNRRYADDGEWPSPGAQSVSGTETPDTVDPQLSGTDQQGLAGDFDSIALDSAETQPKDASRKYFADFDRWVAATTGRTARQHANPNFIRRVAARYCQGKGIPVEAMFPTLGNVLREARRNESSTNRRSQMRKRADESLDVAAPQDRIDVEKPVSNTTDADAQASQFDLGDFGGNAGDNLADPELSPDSQIWAPGEGDSSKTSNRKADGMAAVRYAEAYIAAGLAPNTPTEKWKIAGLAQTMRHGTIVDRTRLLDAINAQRASAVRRTAGVNRGAGSSIPPNFGQRQMTAGQAREAANDISSDVAIWLR